MQLDPARLVFASCAHLKTTQGCPSPFRTAVRTHRAVAVHTTCFGPRCPRLQIAGPRMMSLALKDAMLPFGKCHVLQFFCTDAFRVALLPVWTQAMVPGTAALPSGLQGCSWILHGSYAAIVHSQGTKQERHSPFRKALRTHSAVAMRTRSAVAMLWTAAPSLAKRCASLGVARAQGCCHATIGANCHVLNSALKLPALHF
jgi:hypothetical protein